MSIIGKVLAVCSGLNVICTHEKYLLENNRYSLQSLYGSMRVTVISQKPFLSP